MIRSQPEDKIENNYKEIYNLEFLILNKCYNL